MKMRALSIWQPWAHLIVHGTCTGRRKTIETRAWRFLPSGLLGQPLAIHAALHREPLFRWPFQSVGVNLGIVPSECVYGALIGRAVIDDVCWLRAGHEPEALCECVGRVGIILKFITALPKPIPCRGHQGFFWVEIP